MTQSDITQCLEHLHLLWSEQLERYPSAALIYPNEAMDAWAATQGIPHDAGNPWYRQAYDRLRKRLTAASAASHS